MAKGTNKVRLDGYTFDSPSEKQFYLKLKGAKEEGHILKFTVEQKFTLQDEFQNWRDEKEAAITHLPDYCVVLNDGSKIVIDSKGGSQHEQLAVVKRKLWMKLHPNIPYYFVSTSSEFIGGEWIETTPGHDFNKKLRYKHNSLFPGVNNKLKLSPKLPRVDWYKWFDYEEIAGLFYTYKKMYTKVDLKKIAKEKEKEV